MIKQLLVLINISSSASSLFVTLMYVTVDNVSYEKLLQQSAAVSRHSVYCGQAARVMFSWHWRSVYAVTGTQQSC